MPENSPYFEFVISERSVLLSEEQALTGSSLVSLETTEEGSRDGVLDYIQQNFAQFLRSLRHIDKESQEILLTYYLAGKTQNTLAVIHRQTQTMCSTAIREGVEQLGAIVLMSTPKRDAMAVILQRENAEHILPGVEMSAAIELYARSRSYQTISDAYRVHRADVRRAFRHAAEILGAAGGNKALSVFDRQARGLAAYIRGLTAKASATGTGLTQKKTARRGYIVYKSPDCLGQSVLNVNDPGFGEVFTPVAEHRNSHSMASEPD